MAEQIRPDIIAGLCNGCGACVDVCPDQAIRIVDGLATIDLSKVCAFCGNCEAVCPTEAIRRQFLIVFAAPDSPERSRAS